MNSTDLLSVTDVSKTFGGVRAVDGCTLSVRGGTITGLIGPNGAGKSTLFDVIIGLLPPDAGQITFEGSRIDGLLPHRIVRLGLAKTFQIPREFRSLTVLENLLVAAPTGAGESLWTLVLRPLEVRRRVEDLTNRAEELLKTVGLRTLRDEFARNLSGGQKKLLELARALMISPKMVLLDEPVAGINPVLANKLVLVIEGLRKQGTTFFLVEHDMDVVMRHCDHVIVMHQGRRLAEGAPQEIREDPRVIESYLGA